MKPIPSKILRTNALVMVCTGVDRYQHQTYNEYALTRVHLQPTNEVRKTQDNTDVVLRSILFVDARTSKPTLDWCALLQGTHALKGDMRVIVRDVEYTVIGVDELRDDKDKIHHWEVLLV